MSPLHINVPHYYVAGFTGYWTPSTICLSMYFLAFTGYGTVPFPSIISHSINASATSTWQVLRLCTLKFSFPTKKCLRSFGKYHETEACKLDPHGNSHYHLAPSLPSILTSEFFKTSVWKSIWTPRRIADRNRVWICQINSFEKIVLIPV